MQYIARLATTALLPFKDFGWVLFALYSLVIFICLFIISHTSLIYTLISSTLPLALLIDAFVSFIKGDSIHSLFQYILIATLGGIYINTIRYVFLHKNYFSKGSFVTSLFSTVGIAIGISCISCGFAALILVFSFFGISSSFVLLSIAQPYMLPAGIAILIASIVLSLISLDRLNS